MFRKPRFPLPTIEKVNIEYHLDWIFRRFGDSPIFDYESLTVTSPSIARFVSSNGVDLGSIQDLIVDRFPFDCGDCELIAWDGKSEVPPHPDIILLNPEEQTNPEALISRIACHLSRRQLADLEVDQFERADPLLLSELMPVFFGWGVFSANVALQTTQYSSGESHYWQHRKYTDTAARHLGVALAYRTWIRDDPKEDLSPALRPDARVPFRKTLKYLLRTGDSLLINPPNQPSVFANDNVQQLIVLLENASASKTVGVLQQLIEITEADSLSQNEVERNALLPRLPKLMMHMDQSVRTLACRICHLFGSVNGQVLEGIRDLLSDPVSEIRQEATSSIVYLAPAGQVLARDLIISLKDDDSGVVDAAVKGLIYLQQKEEDVVPELLKHIRKVLNLGGSIDLDFLFAALDTVSINAEDHLNDFLQADQEELRLALCGINEWRQKRGSSDEFDDDCG